MSKAIPYDSTLYLFVLEKRCPLGRAFGRALELSLLAGMARVLETEAAPGAVE